MMLEEKLKNTIRDVADFPKPGILFKDITPIFQNPQLCKEVISKLKEIYKNKDIEGVAGIESRGFLLGLPLALALGVPFIPIRKKGKLPYKKQTVSYTLEYGTAEIEIHDDAIIPHQRILIHDDLLATGGSANAAATLIEKLGGTVAGFNFLIDLSFLNGTAVLKKNFNTEITSLIQY